LRKQKEEKLKEEKFWSTFFYFNVPKNKTELPAHLQRVNFRLWNHVCDMDLLRMVSRVKSINMLDLDETDITNKGIQHLTQLHQLKELRLKGIKAIDDDCLQYLNTFSELELLHLGGTSVTLDGIKKLSSLKKLKVLLLPFSYGPEIKEKMFQLKTILPTCEFILNYKPYEFDLPVK
jgi:hypothetical protein